MSSDMLMKVYHSENFSKIVNIYVMFYVMEEVHLMNEHGKVLTMSVCNESLALLRADVDVIRNCELALKIVLIFPQFLGKSYLQQVIVMELSWSGS